MKLHQNFEKGSPEYVFYHGLHRISKGKNPSAHLSSLHTLDKNPRTVFALAKSIVKDCSTEERKETLLGRPFLRTQVNWGKMYQLHLTGPHADIPFSPQSGIDTCACSTCFYRDGNSNPKRDCQIGENGDMAKNFFGLSSDKFLPNIIGGKEVAHYCPYWLIFTAD